MPPILEVCPTFSWQQITSWIVVQALQSCYRPLNWLGSIVEWTINFFLLNGGLFRLLFKLFTFQWGRIILPDPTADNFLSCVGALDPRCDLYVDTSRPGKASSTRADGVVFPDENVGSRSTADVCVMAAKLAYENPAVVKRVVKDIWKMNFVKFYECWNENQQMDNTQAFIFTDKPKDANAVVVAFRGTEAFNAYDWSTDLDFTWADLVRLGGVHLGFLEALGLASRKHRDTIERLNTNAIASSEATEAREQAEATATRTPVTPHRRSKEDIEKAPSTSGLAQGIIDDPAKELAYDAITKRVGLILKENPRAKLFITGHSLGGALASLYATMLHYTGQTEIASKIGAVYTFGQPRVGDQDFVNYANSKLKGKFFRVVYCNDVVPRVPFDDIVMAYKHIGDCNYFNSVYKGIIVKEEPNRNYSILWTIFVHLNAVWEIVQGLFFITLLYGNQFSESTVCLLFRILGLAIPGFAAHSPCNYVNSVRLGPLPLRKCIPCDVADISQGIALMEDNVKDILCCILVAFFGNQICHSGPKCLFHARNCMPPMKFGAKENL
ncbi:triacylglycerol lipase OBL1 [Physcomitrium patens]|uniref:Fungal lipase-type domain-containing protein n=2 Tax=Physcomitrium patens TaxID=3218 RepID=A0A2K1KTC3_PHYPA|nr:uncharacterized protein LOC112279699 [Physcomitrium patens]PNR57010.1 hypothetical protein PHYPA_004003 [Physcomitrium patens]|eukprot:XP_024370144.1 uncharacterized protein LOC112279699 [Physcomitrella patens]